MAVKQNPSTYCITLEAERDQAVSAGRRRCRRRLLFFIAAALLALGRQPAGSGLRAGSAQARGKATAQPPAQFYSFADPAGVPAITAPQFLSPEKADQVMKDDEPVVGLAMGGETRAYSLWHLEHHLVVNDRIAGRPISVTWDPFSHTAAVYSRQVGDRELTFESDGRLLHDALVLRDRETGTVWTQQDGMPIQGPLAGRGPLPQLPALQAAWKVWKQEQPATVVLDKGPNPATASSYAAYYADPHKLGLGHTELRQPRMGGKALIVGIVAGPDRVAIPLDKLKRDLIVNTVADRQAVAALYDPATGTVRVVRREARGQTLTLRRGFGDIFGKPTAPYLVDEEMASRWDFAGRATSGRMQGHRLPLFPHRVQFWYAWQAYFPRSQVE